jgi:hypothetical protein
MPWIRKWPGAAFIRIVLARAAPLQVDDGVSSNVPFCNKWHWTIQTTQQLSKLRHLPLDHPMIKWIHAFSPFRPHQGTGRTVVMAISTPRLKPQGWNPAGARISRHASHRTAPQTTFFAFTHVVIVYLTCSWNCVRS